MFQRYFSQLISARLALLAWLMLITSDLCCGDRLGCEDGQDIPSNRVNTTERLERLRQLMAEEPHRVDAYIVPMNDAHQSEYVAPREARVQFISGFSGSSGLVVVTWNSAALWTDGRYFLQADNQIDCNWSLMKNGSDPKPPSETEWLISELAEGSSVGADPRLVSATRWKFMERALTDGGLAMKVVHENLVDMVWTEGRPPPSSDPIYVHDIKYSGVNWESKVDQVRSLLKERRVAALVITSLDEVAWLFNLRGNDIPHTPVFYSYAVVDYNSAHLWVNVSKLSPAAQTHLQSADCLDNSPCVQVHAYDEVLYDIHDLVSNKWTGKVIVPGRSSYTDGASYSIYNRVFSSDRLHEESPLVALKGRKNAVEVVNMRNASRRDSLAICDFLSFLEEQIGDGEVWDELSAARKLEEIRSAQPLHMGPSFETISAFSSNAAIIHYTPSNSTSRRIDASSTYLLDSGGQYLDGTTDVTRTMHFGKPSEFQRETYTRVLMGVIDLARLTIAHGTKDNQLGVVARRHLFDVGLNYRHGTGHGIGCFLAVHEGPTLISGGVGHLIELGQFFSDEPGYYEPEQFGIRLETILHVKKADVKYGVDGRYYQFEPITLVPFEPKLIIPELMTEKQLVWLNEYHMRVWDELKTTLAASNKTRALRWLKKRIQPITRTRHTRRNPSSGWQTSAHEAADHSTRSSSCRRQGASVFLLALIAYSTQ